MGGSTFLDIRGGGYCSIPPPLSPPPCPRIIRTLSASTVNRFFEAKEVASRKSQPLSPTSPFLLYDLFSSCLARARAAASAYAGG